MKLRKRLYKLYNVAIEIASLKTYKHITFTVITFDSNSMSFDY